MTKTLIGLNNTHSALEYQAGVDKNPSPQGYPVDIKRAYRSGISRLE